MKVSPVLSKYAHGLSGSRSIKSAGANSPLNARCESVDGYEEITGNGEAFAAALFHVTENNTVGRES